MSAGALELAQRDFLDSLPALLENLLDFLAGSGSGIESSSGKTLMTMACLITGAAVGGETEAGLEAAAEVGAAAGARATALCSGSAFGGAAANASAPDSIRSSSVNRVTFADLRSLEYFPLCSGEVLLSVDRGAEVDVRVVAEVLRLALMELESEYSGDSSDPGSSSCGWVYVRDTGAGAFTMGAMEAKPLMDVGGRESRAAPLAEFAMAIRSMDESEGWRWPTRGRRPVLSAAERGGGARTTGGRASLISRSS